MSGAGSGHRRGRPAPRASPGTGSMCGRKLAVSYAMTDTGEPRRVDSAPEPRWDFFISYTQTDRNWAEWVAWTLEEAGHQVLIETWDFVPGSNWQVGMQQAVARSERTIALLSPAYLRSVFGQQEWQSAQAADPRGFARKLVPIRLAECERPGLLARVRSFDLFDLDEAAARKRLLDQIGILLAGRAKPVRAPDFPGPAASSVARSAARPPATGALPPPPP